MTPAKRTPSPNSDLIVLLRALLRDTDAASLVAKRARLLLEALTRKPVVLLEKNGSWAARDKAPYSSFLSDPDAQDPKFCSFVTRLDRLVQLRRAILEARAHNLGLHFVLNENTGRIIRRILRAEMNAEIIGEADRETMRQQYEATWPGWNKRKLRGDL